MNMRAFSVMLQGKLQRCAVRCQDQAQDSLGATPSDSEVKKAQVLFSPFDPTPFCLTPEKPKFICLTQMQ